MKVLLAGESWVIHSTHMKGFDQFTETKYGEGGKWLIEALEKQNDTLDKQKELEEKTLAVEKAREALENARKNRTLQVYRER